MITTDTYIHGNLNVDNKLLVSNGIVATSLPVVGNTGEIKDNAKTRSMTMAVNGESITYITVSNYGIIMHRDGDRFGTAIIHDEHILDTSYLYSEDDHTAEYICTLSFNNQFYVRLYSTDRTLLHETVLSHTELPSSYNIIDMWDRTSITQYEAIGSRCWFYIIKSDTQFIRLSITYINNSDKLNVDLNINYKSRSSCVFNTNDILTNSKIRRFINSSTIILYTGTICVPAYASAVNDDNKWYLDYTAIDDLNGIDTTNWEYITQVTHPTLPVIWSFLSITENNQTSIWVGLRVNNGSSSAFNVSSDTSNSIQKSDRFTIYSTIHTATGSIISVITENVLYTMELTYDIENKTYQSDIRIDCDNLKEYGKLVFYINNPDVLEICTQLTDGGYQWNVFDKNTRTMTVSNITLDNISTIIRTHGSIIWTTNGPAIIDRAVVNATVPMIGPTITDLYKRIDYLEQRIASLEYYINDGDFRVNSINDCLIGKETTKLFTDERFTSSTMGVLPVLNYEKSGDNPAHIGMEVGSYIDFHSLGHPECNGGDSCGRIMINPAGEAQMIVCAPDLRIAAVNAINKENLLEDAKYIQQYTK